MATGQFPTYQPNLKGDGEMNLSVLNKMKIGQTIAVCGFEQIFVLKLIKIEKAKINGLTMEMIDDLMDECPIPKKLKERK